MNQVELAAKTAAEIRRRGWYQGNYGSDRGDPTNCEVCLVGAMHAAECNHPWAMVEDYSPSEAFNSLFKEIQVRIGSYRIATWNDEDGRTEQEVLDLLDSIATEIK